MGAPLSRATIIIQSEADRQRAVKQCAQCGSDFARDVRNTWAYWEKRAKYCSHACAGAANSIRWAAKRPSLEDKFKSHFTKSSGCWEWQGPCDKDGYGLFFYTATQYRAARLALKLDGRPVPSGMYACHHCDNPVCVRASHLYVGSPKQNVEDALRRGRKNPMTNAKLTEHQVIAIRKAAGTHEAIAAQYDVSRATVSLIRGRRTWRHLP